MFTIWKKRGAGCQLAPPRPSKKGSKLFGSNRSQIDLSLRLSVNHINGVSLNLLVRPLDQALSFRFPNCMRLEKEPTTKGTCTLQPMVVYHLFRRTGRFTVCANSLHFRFSPGIAYHCTSSSVYRKNGLEGPKLVSKMALKKKGTRISVWNIPSGKKKKTSTFFRTSIALGNFALE